MSNINNPIVGIKKHEWENLKQDSKLKTEKVSKEL